MDKKFQIKGQYPPATFISSIDGKRWAVSGSAWVEIPLDMPYPEIFAGWIDTNKPTNKAHDKPQGRAFKVPSSKPSNPSYLVTLINGYFNCNCVGFGYHRTCSHIDKVKAKLALEVKQTQPA